MLQFLWFGGDNLDSKAEFFDQVDQTGGDGLGVRHVAELLRPVTMGENDTLAVLRAENDVNGGITGFGHDHFSAKLMPT